MSSEPLALLPLAESIADGAVVDWAAAETRASGDQQAIIRQLRVVADLAMLHRSLPAEPGDWPPAAIAPRTLTTMAIGSWGHLAMIERLGGGTFGEVYRAWDRHLEREVAVKLLRDESLYDPLASRITAEGRLLARVRHPNVIIVHGVAVQDGKVGLWMELIRGATLEQILLKNGPFGAREASLIGIDLCRALAAIHAAGLIHRDVKAPNVMREDGGRTVLMDLGTGREIDPSRRHGLSDLAGTPLYIAPEIFEGASASEQTDLYSLGVLLYHLVTGSFPVRATTIDELRDGHAKGTGVRLRDARADLPTAFVRVVDRAIARDPGRRYASAGALEADLGDAIDETAAASSAAAVPARRKRVFIWPRGGLLMASLATMFALVAFAWTYLNGTRASGALAGTIRSIAVLPLTNLSGDPSQEYFADGMTEELIDDLAKIRALRVISRTSVMQYKGTTKPLPEIAHALNVDAVLEGSVSRSGNRVRISADLVHVGSDRHVWVESYDRDLSDVLALQSEVARTIAREVRIQLTPPEQAGFAMNRAVDLSAQEAYFQGRYFWNKRTSEGLQKALAYFRQSADSDPSFARAYVGQADTYNLLPGGLSPFVAYPLAKAAAAKALAIDPTLAEAQTSLAFATFVFDRDYPRAEAAFQRAIQLNPGYVTAHHWYGEYLSAMGRLDEANAEFERAMAIDPLSSSIRTSRADTLYYGGQYDKAIAALRTSLDIDPGNPSTYLSLARTYEKRGSFAEALATTRSGLERAMRNAPLTSELGRLAALTGDRATAVKTAEGLTAMATQRWFGVDCIAHVYVALGDGDRAFAFLRRAEQERSPSLLWAKVSPVFDSYRADLKFHDLLRQLRLAQ